jgi:hypothetical protein
MTVEGVRCIRWKVNPVPGANPHVELVDAVCCGGNSDKFFRFAITGVVVVMISTVEHGRSRMGEILCLFES